MQPSEVPGTVALVVLPKFCLSLCLCRHEPPVTSQPIRIVHEDDEVLVINKPSSIPVCSHR